MLRGKICAKKYIDNKAIFYQCSGNDKRLSEDVTRNYEMIKKKDIKFKNYEPVKKKLKVDKEEIDILKVKISKESESKIFKSQFKSSLKSNKEITSTSAEEVPMKIECKELIKSETFSTNGLVGKIWCRPTWKLMDDVFNHSYCDKNLYDSTNSIIRPATVNLSENVHKITLRSTEVSINDKNLPSTKKLNEIRKLYSKYFTKLVQDTTVIIANILNIIYISNLHLKTRTYYAALKEISEAKKETCNAKLLHKKHTKTLENKLNEKVFEVVSTFDDLDFESSFQIFLLTILNIFEFLVQKQNKCSIFKNALRLLLHSFKNSEHRIPKVLSIVMSKRFYTHIINLKKLIEDSVQSDPGISDCMPLFYYGLTINNREHFQRVINAIISNSKEDLGLLIDNAFYQCCINSKFTDPKYSSAVTKYVDKTLKCMKTVTTAVSTATVESHNETFRQPMIRKNPDTLLKLETSSTTAVPIPTTTTATLNKFNTSIQTIRPVTFNTINKTNANTFIFDNKQYEFVKNSPPIITKCHVKICKRSATMKCGRCKSVEYCSKFCQEKDWYHSHFYNCDRLLALRTNQH